MRLVKKSLADKSGTGDIAAVNAFQRMIDDGVVRSEDVRLQREATSLVQQLKAWKNQADKGEGADQGRDVSAAGGAGHTDDGSASLREIRLYVEKMDL